MLNIQCSLVQVSLLLGNAPSLTLLMISFDHHSLVYLCIRLIRCLNLIYCFKFVADVADVCFFQTQRAQLA